MARLPSLFLLVVLSACNRAPNAAESLEVLRSEAPALDSATVLQRVWADGPPWFSCAEVIAKLRSSTDSATVRNPLGNWRSLVLADWVQLRDTTAGPVTEPGWCRATLRNEPARLASGWRAVLGPLMPVGDPRRGWDVPAGHRRIVVRNAARKIGKDSISVDFLLTVKPNANGVALGADRDSIPRRALLVKQDGRWRAVNMAWAGAR